MATARRMSGQFSMMRPVLILPPIWWQVGDACIAVRPFERFKPHRFHGFPRATPPEMNQTSLIGRAAGIKRLFQRICDPAGFRSAKAREGKTKSVLAERDAFQPTIQLAKVSITKARQTNPCHPSHTFFECVAG